MANAHKGESSIDLNGQTYTLALTLNAMVEIESALGKSFDQVLAEAVTGKGSVTQLRVILWAAMLKHHPTMTLAQVGELVTFVDLKDVGRTMNQIVTASGPDPKDVPKTKNPTSARPVAGGTGASSTSPPAVSG